jgi:hypothetical protein
MESEYTDQFFACEARTTSVRRPQVTDITEIYE